MEEDKRKRVSPIPDNVNNVLNHEQKLMLSKMEGFGWELKYVRRALFQDIVPILFHQDSGHHGVLEEDGTLNTHSDLKIRD
jgi:hypothetical protein